MEIVRPIKDINKIHQIEKILKEDNIRDYLLFRVGIYSGLRISDILKLKVCDLKNQTHFILRETKTGKPKKLKIQPELKKELDLYLQDKPDDEYIFKSQKGDNQPITKVQAYRIINGVARKVGIKGEIGTHTLRKTFGYWFYNSTGDIATLQYIFNHSNQKVTLRYIDIIQDEIDNMIDNFSYDIMDNSIIKSKRKRLNF